MKLSFLQLQQTSNLLGGKAETSIIKVNAIEVKPEGVKSAEVKSVGVKPLEISNKSIKVSTTMPLKVQSLKKMFLHAAA